jgi:glucan phosphoethanolaminetransferase (alkaline phosphatase superfamily)
MVNQSKSKMIIEIFIYILLVVIVFLLLKIIKSKESLFFKLILSFAILVIVIFCFIYFVISGWESGRNPKEAEITLEDYPKSIYFFNGTNKKVNIIVNFKYLENENLKFKNLNFNKIDTIKNLIFKHQF